MKVAIVGAEKAKFTLMAEAQARQQIVLALTEATLMISGGCHLGGIDIWAEEEADRLGIPKMIHRPQTLSWHSGYKPRNILIAQSCDVLYNITVDKYPPNFKGIRFDECYHCGTTAHVKSGGCWTMKLVKLLKKPTFPITVINDPV